MSEEDRNARIITLWRQGLTMATIAHTIGEGLTRNAAMGVVERYRKKGDVAPHVPRPPGGNRVSARRPNVAATMPTESERALLWEERKEEHAKALERLRKLEERPPVQLIQHQPEADPEGLGGVSVKNIRFGQCRWVQPEKHQGLAVYCGQPVKPGKSFCPGHYTIAYTRSIYPIRRPA